MSAQLSAKRKLDEVISALDDAVRPTPERAPPPKRTIVSIYATLAKYGIPTSTKAYPRKSRNAKTKPAAAATVDSLPLTSLYRPSSLPCLLARLETFKLSTFSGKPTPIDSLACALAGWTNDGKERLVCGLCKGSWVVASVLGMKPEAARVLVEKQVNSLVREHHDGCPWKAKQCDRSLYSVPLASPSQLLGEIIQLASILTPLLERVNVTHPLLSEQVASLEKTSKSFQEKEQRRLARLQDREPEQLQSTDPNQRAAPILTNGTTAPQNGDEVRTASQTLTAFSMSALIVALFGWRPTAAAPSSRPSFCRAGSTISRAGSVGMSPVPSRAGTPAPETSPRRMTLNRIGSQVSLMEVDSETPNQPLIPEKTMLCCEMCFRRVPLWGLLQPISTTSADTSAHSSPPKAGRILDLVKEHRHSCAYVTATSSLPSLRASAESSEESSELLTGWQARLSTALRFGMGEAARLEGFGLRPSLSHSESNQDLGSTIGRSGTKEVLTYLRRLLG